MLAAINGGKDSWIEQLTKKPSTKLTDGSDLAKLDVKKETAKLKARLAKAKKSDDDKQVRRIEKRLEEIEAADRERRECETHRADDTAGAPRRGSTRRTAVPVTADAGVRPVTGRAVGDGVVELRDHRVRFVDPLLPSFVYQQLTGRQRVQLEQRRRDNAQRAFATDEYARQVIAGGRFFRTCPIGN